MFVTNSPDAFTFAEESLERRSRERGSAMHAQTKSEATCMSVRSRSLMVCWGEAAWEPPLSSGTESEGGVARFGASATGLTASRWTVRLSVSTTLGSEMLNDCPWPTQSVDAGAY